MINRWLQIHSELDGLASESCHPVVDRTLEKLVSLNVVANPRQSFQSVHELHQVRELLDGAGSHFPVSPEELVHEEVRVSDAIAGEEQAIAQEL